MHSETQVSVIVPHYEDLKALDLCLSALERQTYARQSFEIIVGDNNSSCGKAALAAAIRGRARLVVVTERGAGPARNGAAALARGAILAFTDSDCVPEPQWLAEGIAALENNDIIGGKVEVLVGDPAAPTPTEAFEKVFAFNFEDYILRKGFTGSGNLFVPKATFEHIGGFKVGVSEDVEWSLRAREKGYAIGYAPAAAVGHPARRSWDELKTKWRRVNSESFGLLAPKPGGRLKWMARTWAMPLSALVHTPRVLFSEKLPSLKAKLGALLILYRSRLWRFFDGNRLLLGLKR